MTCCASWTRTCGGGAAAESRTVDTISRGIQRVILAHNVVEHDAAQAFREAYVCRPLASKGPRGDVSRDRL